VFKPTIRPSKTLLVMAAVLTIPAIIFAVEQVQAGVEAAELGGPVFERLDVPDDASPAEFEEAITAIFDELDIPPEQRETIQHSGHWSGMAGFSVGLIALTAIVAVRVRGFRVTAWSVGMAIAYYGLVSLATPDDASSVGLVGGILCILWGTVFIALTEREARTGATESIPALT
jgi:hypothetical protein